MNLYGSVTAPTVNTGIPLSELPPAPWAGFPDVSTWEEYEQRYAVRTYPTGEVQWACPFGNCPGHRATPAKKKASVMRGLVSGKDRGLVLCTRHCSKGTRPGNSLGLALENAGEDGLKILENLHPQGLNPYGVSVQKKALMTWWCHEPQKGQEGLGGHWHTAWAYDILREKGLGCSSGGYRMDRPGWLYVVREPGHGDGGLVKIGISNVPRARLQRHHDQGLTEVVALFVWEGGALPGGPARHWEAQWKQVRRERIPMELWAGKELLPDGFTETVVASGATQLELKRFVARVRRALRSENSDFPGVVGRVDRTDYHRVHQAA